MGLEKFSFALLPKMNDGRIGLTVDEEIERCLEDLRNRPGLDKTRTVTLTISMKPRTDGQDLESADIAVDVKSAIPKRSTKAYNMRAAKNGLFFNDVDPMNPDQRTIDEYGADGEEEGKVDKDTGVVSFPKKQEV